MGKASREKKLRKRQRTVQQALIGRVRRSLPEGQIKVVKRHTGRKVSEMVTELAQPWLDESRNDDQRRMALNIAVLAWNMAILPEPERWEGMSPELARSFGELGQKFLREAIDRKLALFPDEQQSILDYEITGGGGDLRLDLAFSVPRNEIDPTQMGITPDKAPG